MSEFTIEAATVLKAAVRPSGQLLPRQKRAAAVGDRFLIVNSTPDRDQHLCLTLTAPILADDGKTPMNCVYAYAPHIKVNDPNSQLIKLPVPYFQQNNNDTEQFGPGWRQCNTTSNAMLADYLLKGTLSEQAKKQGLREPESLYMRYVAKYGDTTDHDAQTAALKDLGIQSYFSKRVSEADVMRSLRAGIPVVCGFAYKSSGHICIIVGHDAAKRVWLVHDPYGIRYGASNQYDVNARAAFDEYSYSVMQQVFWDMGKEAGWGRIVTSVRGKSTSLPTGL